MQHQLYIAIGPTLLKSRSGSLAGEDMSASRFSNAGVACEVSFFLSNLVLYCLYIISFNCIDVVTVLFTVCMSQLSKHQCRRPQHLFLLCHQTWIGSTFGQYSNSYGSRKSHQFLTMAFDSKNGELVFGYGGKWTCVAVVQRSCELIQVGLTEMNL